MTLLLHPMPLSRAIDKIGAKSPIAAVLRSDEWSQVPVALRERAQFSAGVESARLLQGIQDKLQSAIRMQRETVAAIGDRGPQQAFVDRSSFIADIRKLAIEEGIQPGAGDLTDITSRARLGLIFDMQTQQAQNFARWKMDQDPDVLNAFPAQELIRVESRIVPRDWQSRWDENGGPRYGNAGYRMVALKTDPIWQNISAFGVPWPPFDFGSGMGLSDLSRKDAEELGLLAPDEPPIAPGATGGDIDFNSDLQASAAVLDPILREKLKRWLGNKIEFIGDTVRWILTHA